MMINSIADYENWRDRMYDRPEPEGSEESMLLLSTKTPVDTVNVAIGINDRILLVRDHTEGWDHNLLDITGSVIDGGVIDDQDMPLGEAVRLLFDEYGLSVDGNWKLLDFDFDAWLAEEDRPFAWIPIPPHKVDWLYSGSKEEDRERRCFGHLRIDFGSDGTEFWSTWFPHLPDLVTPAFRNELQATVDALREKGKLLENSRTMRRLCAAGTPVEESYGFYAATRKHTYCLRCIPMRGSYNAYLYCYDRGTGD